jgi:hypothetical protein
MIATLDAKPTKYTSLESSQNIAKTQVRTLAMIAGSSTFSLLAEAGKATTMYSVSL